jgi:hypothetical protein
MTEQPKIKLSRLREIGWSLWDPIGLRGLSDGDWQDGGACADEYDDYLLQVAGRLRRGDPTAEVIAYLEETETGHIGLTRSVTTRSRAEATVAAIASYLAALPTNPLKVR